MSYKAMRIGLTGGIGAGKTYVARIIQTMGYPVFHSDVEAKNILNNDEHIHAEIRHLFGEDIMHHGKPNKVRLAELIFSNNEKREKLNALIHPRVREQFEVFCVNFPQGIVFNEAAILFETGAYRNLDATILVTAPEKRRLLRIVERDNCTMELAKAKIASQWSDEKKLPLADYHIINDNQTPLLSQVEEIISNCAIKWTSNNQV
jgi:dephospho-CoA kinase